ncbi:hypothetical protein HZS55_02290 [Halosimplex rubrum]|uniref:Uncharacterized protein n=1 Tax=Halosimplex rubrum TaxID=869889 RepID=A0A7D5SXR2_9EURY|nr:hypothetical protein [Halosimplex rubrum]QLH75768.1 hypothetical protein HZS55_02290 [Halosimplex rubrum]
MQRRTVATVAIAVAALLAGCSGFLGGPGSAGRPASPTDEPVSPTERPSPPTERRADRTATAGPTATATPEAGTGTATPTGPTTPNRTADGDGAMAENPPDPETDRLGWEGGYWYNETIDVNQTDGLSESERSALVARTMARVERVDGRDRTWRIEAGAGFGDAFRLRVANETVTVVNASSVEGLSDVHREPGNRSEG